MHRCLCAEDNFSVSVYKRSAGKGWKSYMKEKCMWETS